MSNFLKLIIATFASTVLFGCASSGSYTGKDSYAFYLSSDNGGFSTPNGTLNRGGVLNVTFDGENFTGQNANNKIEAKGNRGTHLNCAYTMPAETGIGSCKTSTGQILKMKFE